MPVIRFGSCFADASLGLADPFLLICKDASEGQASRLILLGIWRMPPRQALN